MTTAQGQGSHRPGDEWSGTVALVTGASRGIGAATARAFAAAGAQVVLAARDGAALAVLAREIEASGGAALAVPTDVGDETAVARLVERTLATYGRLDAAFNNAGGGPRPAPLAELSCEDFDTAVRVNLRGVFLSLKFEIPAMVAGGGGAIVNMSSTAGRQGVRGIAGYVAAKYGIIGLTETAALEYAGQNIRVNAVAPGPILTHRLGRPEEVAALVLWLCSDQAGFVTGATIPIDGGRLAGVA